MKLFEGFEAVRFPEENLIFVTNNEFLYYIYNPKYGDWRKHGDAGFDSISVENYPDITMEELAEIMKGKIPEKETDFMRFCNSGELCIRDMLQLLDEDFPALMSDRVLYRTIHRILLESNICYKSYDKIRELLTKAAAENDNAETVIRNLREFSLSIIGRDIFKRKIGIVDGHDSSSYFWIQPARVIDYKDTTAIDNVAEMGSVEISIEEDDVAQYLTPFLYRYFDDELEANKNRIETRWEDEDGNEEVIRVEGFEWYLTHNFFTYESISKILSDIRDTIQALSHGIETDYTKELKIKRGFATNELIYAKDLSAEQIKEYNDNRPTEDDTEVELVIDFYKRFIFRMEYMIKVGEENGYDLISFMGP